MRKPSFPTPPPRQNFGNIKVPTMTKPLGHPKAKSLHYDDVVAAYFERLTEEGHDLADFNHFRLHPAGIPPTAMLRFADHVGTDIGELLRNGIGRNNTYDAVDNAVRRHYQGKCLAPVELLD